MKLGVHVAGDANLTIPFWLHQMAFDSYKQKGGKFASAEQVINVGGFHVKELDTFLPDWRDRLVTGVH